MSSNGMEVVVAAATTEDAATVDEAGNLNRMVVLITNDNQKFLVEESLVVGSKTIKNIIGDLDEDCTQVGVPLPNVSGPILARVIEFWKRHAKDDKGSTETKQWEKGYLADMDREKLFGLILAANYLNAKPLLDFLCDAVADYIKNMKVEEVREYFNIDNDYSKEEENEVRAENAWAFDGVQS